MQYIFTAFWCVISAMLFSHYLLGLCHLIFSLWGCITIFDELVLGHHLIVGIWNVNYKFLVVYIPIACEWAFCKTILLIPDLLYYKTTCRAFFSYATALIWLKSYNEVEYNDFLKMSHFEAFFVRTILKSQSQWCLWAILSCSFTSLSFHYKLLDPKENCGGLKIHCHLIPARSRWIVFTHTALLHLFQFWDLLKQWISI